MKFLLVHGAFQGAKVWSELVARLEQNGHEAKAITLPGRDGSLGDVAQIHLEDYVKAIHDALLKSSGKFRLVCHSFAGIHGAIAASRCVEKTERLFFVAANLAKEGETTCSLLGRSFQAELRRAVQETGDLEFPGNPKKTLFNRCRPRVKKSVSQFLCREPALPYFDVVRYEADWSACLHGGIRYYRGTEDRAIDEYQARTYALKAGVVPIRIEGDHQLMLSNPSKLLEELTS